MTKMNKAYDLLYLCAMCVEKVRLHHDVIKYRDAERLGDYSCKCDCCERTAPLYSCGRSRYGDFYQVENLNWNAFLNKKTTPIQEAKDKLERHCVEVLKIVLKHFEPPQILAIGAIADYDWEVFVRRKGSDAQFESNAWDKVPDASNEDNPILATTKHITVDVSEKDTDDSSSGRFPDNTSKIPQGLDNEDIRIALERMVSMGPALRKKEIDEHAFAILHLIEEDPQYQHNLSSWQSTDWQIMLRRPNNGRFYTELRSDYTEETKLKYGKKPLKGNNDPKMSDNELEQYAQRIKRVGFDEGYANGHNTGWREGHELGYSRGLEHGKREADNAIYKAECKDIQLQNETEQLRAYTEQKLKESDIVIKNQQARIEALEKERRELIESNRSNSIHNTELTDNLRGQLDRYKNGMRMIRFAIEDLGPVGLFREDEAVPKFKDPLDEAEYLCKQIAEGAEFSAEHGWNPRGRQ